MSYYKKCHLSIDDVSSCLINLSTKSDSYKSLFEEPFFGFLLKLHNSYRASFTLYAYEDLCVDVPDTWKEEFYNNSDWLKLGFHAISKKCHPKDVSFDTFKASFQHFCEEIKRFAGYETIAYTIRLDYYYANYSWVPFLHNQGVAVLLSSDDGRVSYGLSKEDNSVLYKNGYFNKELLFLRTDFRLESGLLSLRRVIQKTHNNLPFVLFVHEWALGKKNRMILRIILKIMWLLKFNFICD